MRLFLLIGTLLTLVVSPVMAKRLYKYVDENGVTHFTDKAPDTEQPVESRLLRVEGKEIIRSRRSDEEDASVHHFTNNWRGPVEVQIEFVKAENVKADPPLPNSFVLEDIGEQPLLRVEPMDKTKSWSYRIRYSAVPGDPAAKPNTSFAYRLPFRTTESYYVSQGFGGEKTHQSKESFYAVDITLPEGTPVLAARDGKVMHVEEDFYGAGTDAKKYGGRANHVRVLHDDGTMAIYAHLKLESVAVRPGKQLKAGELVGLSGNTGFSTGPHLHFAVQQNKQGELQSIPFKFQNTDGEVVRPVGGMLLGRKSKVSGRNR